MLKTCFINMSDEQNQSLEQNPRNVRTNSRGIIGMLPAVPLNHSPAFNASEECSITLSQWLSWPLFLHVKKKNYKYILPYEQLENLIYG